MHIYADTARLDDIERLNEHSWVTGFTTNPTLVKVHNTKNPRQHAERILAIVKDKPVSIDGPPHIVWSLAPNAIPKVYQCPAGHNLRRRINLTAVCYPEQTLTDMGNKQSLRMHDIVSVFAGRIMDTGNDPRQCIDTIRELYPMVDILWASCRELYHLRLAAQANCDIITMPPSLLDKMASWWGMPLEAAGKLTVQQFLDDAVEWS